VPPVAGLLLAAGAGRRLAQGGPKALCLLDGLPLLSRAALALRGSGAVDELIVVGPPGAAADVRAALDEVLPAGGAVIVDGAATRHGSMHRGLAALSDRVEIVVVHDACRPLAPADLVVRVVTAVHAGADAAVPVVELTETVKELDPAGRIVRTVPREALVRLQTPQAVRRLLLEAAHADCAAADLAADDAVLLAPPDARLVTVDGDGDAFPVIQAADLAVAAAVLARRHAAG
jgi:2-C-methyl-D-erythritol 4-phosphate cytidylyltransferase